MRIRTLAVLVDTIPCLGDVLPPGSALRTCTSSGAWPALIVLCVAMMGVLLAPLMIIVIIPITLTAKGEGK